MIEDYEIGLENKIYSKPYTKREIAESNACFEKTIADAVSNGAVLEIEEFNNDSGSYKHFMLKTGPCTYLSISEKQAVNFCGYKNAD